MFKSSNKITYSINPTVIYPTNPKSHNYSVSIIILGCATILSLLCLIAIPNIYPSARGHLFGRTVLPSRLDHRSRTRYERSLIAMLTPSTRTTKTTGITTETTTTTTTTATSTTKTTTTMTATSATTAARALVAFSTNPNAHQSQRFELPQKKSVLPVENGKSSGSKPGYSRKLPGAIIIGVKKCGTRALLEYLRVHPLVKAPGPEVHFFDKYYHRGLEWYRQQMPLTHAGQLTVEKTPNYFVRPEVPARIKAMAPNVKLLVVVRNPVTRALSDYAQQTTNHPGRLPNFDRLVLPHGPPGAINAHWGGIKFGLYARLLKPWLQQFGRPSNSSDDPQNPGHSGGSRPFNPHLNTSPPLYSVNSPSPSRSSVQQALTQIHFVSGEALISNPAAEMHLVEEFLGLPHFISKDHFYFNKSKGFPCVWKPRRNRTSPFDYHYITGGKILQALNNGTLPIDNSVYSVVPNSTNINYINSSYGTIHQTSDSHVPLADNNSSHQNKLMAEFENNSKLYDALGLSKTQLDTRVSRTVNLTTPDMFIAKHLFDNTGKPGSGSRTHYYQCLGRTKGRAHPTVAPLTLRRLKRFFRNHNRLFFSLVGRNFGWNNGG